MSAGIEVKEFKHIPGVNDAEYIKLLEEHSENWKRIATDAVSKLKRMSAERPKHGEWEYHSNPNIGINPEDAYCSCCGLYVDTTGNIDFDEYNFCPRCGADMRGEAE